MEVNSVNVNNENHRQVVKRIRAVVAQTRLLVVDRECDKYHEERDIVIKSSLPYIVRVSNTAEQEIRQVMSNLPIQHAGCSIGGFCLFLSCLFFSLY